MRRGVASLFIVAVVGAGCGTPLAPERTPAPVTQPQLHDSTAIVEVAPPEPAPVRVAMATVPEVKAFRRPGAPRPFTAIENPGPLDVRRVFLVKEERGRWLHVYLPMRPNGATGWIRGGAVETAEHDYRISISLSRHRLIVRKGNEVVMRENVAVGTGGTPTPTGLFYTTILVQPTNPGGAYGPYAFGLSGYSEVLTSFAGGDGQIAIHGTNNSASIGRDASHGCVRMSNEAITELSDYLPLGTPVRIRA
jgi:lipoprotein-anchoring transpeptidase ErfK/SrfK